MGITEINNFNKVASLRPDLIKYFVNKDDANYIMPNSHSKVNVCCPDCGAKRTMLMYNLSIQGFHCLECSLNISYPNRLIRSIMNQLEGETNCLEYEWSQKWTNKKRYDVYFIKDNKEYIIEMQGEQHYGAGWNRDVPLDQIIINDTQKIELAVQHNIVPIVIDSRISDFDFIFNNIKDSILSEIFDLSVIDLDKCKNDITKNIVKEVCNEYNENPDISINELVKQYKLCRKTVRKYLVQGARLGWCSYDANESYKKSRDRLKKTVIVYSLDYKYINEYASLTVCSEKLTEFYNVNFFIGEISKACKSGKPYKGFYFQFT